MEKHILHNKIGKYLNSLEFENIQKIVDPACGGNQNIPLFLNERKSNDTEICNVDFLFIDRNKVKVIIEIEEANTKPTQILGKLMTSILAKYYIHKNNNGDKIAMDESVCFIQILDTKKLKPNSKKITQWKNIESAIVEILPTLNSKIKSYKLFYGKFDDINLEEIHEYINSILVNKTVT